jgi:transcription antitermination protein NusB
MNKDKASPFLKRARTTARLGAVQALYQTAIAGTHLQDVLKEFIDHKAEGLEAGFIIKDLSYFELLLKGIDDHQADLDRMISEALTKEWSFDRLEVVIKCILRAGIFELWQCPDVPARVIMNEYLDIAHAFFDLTEHHLINGVLDKIARILRPEEFLKS